MLKRVYWWRNLALLVGFGLLSYLGYLLFWSNTRLYLSVEVLIALSGVPLGLLLPPNFLWRPPTRLVHDTGPQHAPMEH